MKKVIKLFLMGYMIVSCSACKKRLTTNDYIQYARNPQHGLVKTVNVDNWDYTFQYKPYDLIAIMEQQGAEVTASAQRIKDLAGTAWFNISFKRSDNNVSPLRFNLSSKDEYDQRQGYLLNQAVKDIVMVYDGKDTLHPMSYEFENNYNLTPQETMVVGFQLPKGEQQPEKSMQLAYNDKVFKNGIIKALFTEKDINNIPELEH